MLNSFLLIGQSNMAGRGPLNEVEPIINNEILMFRAGRWIVAAEPVHTDKPDLAGVGLGMSFAETLQRRFNQKIGLIPCAVGGTSLDEWQKGGALYATAVNETLKAVADSKLKGILWHQGEADSSTLEKAQSYQDRFMVMIGSLLQDIGIDTIPVVLGELGAFLKNRSDCPYSSVINDSLAAIASKERYFKLASAEGLVDKGDTLHFNSESLREFGKRYAAEWLQCSREMGLFLE